MRISVWSSDVCSSDLDIAAVFVQDLEDLGREILGRQAQPVTDLPGAKARTVFVTAFDAARLITQVKHLLPAGAAVVSLDALRLPDAMLTNRQIGRASGRERVCQYV